jgi:sugar lactone lactonase YvrE
VSIETLLEGLMFGESVRWHEGRAWVCDWHGGQVIALGPSGGADTVIRLGTFPVCIDWLPDGRLLAVAGGDAKVLRLELSGELSVHATLGEVSEERWNEVAVAADGTAFVNGGDGVVAVVAPDGTVRQVVGDIAFPNGMAITADQSTLIVAESHANQLTAFDIADSGSLSGRRVWAHVGGGVPDGICLDAQGALWYADVPNRCCVRVCEGGMELARIEVDRGCFSCALGERDGPALFIAATQWRGFEAMFEVPPTSQLLAVGVEVGGISA